MIEQFEKVLQQIVAPQYDGVDDVSVSPIGLDDSFLRVKYYINKDLKFNDIQKLLDETDSLYRMLGIKDGDFTVSFEKNSESEEDYTINE